MTHGSCDIGTELDGVIVKHWMLILVGLKIETFLYGVNSK